MRPAALALVLATPVGIRGLADFVRFIEQHLRDAFIRVDLRRQRRGVRELQRLVTFPLRLQRRHVDDDAAARLRSEEHTSELQSLMRTSYAVFCLNKKKLRANISNAHI